MNRMKKQFLAAAALLTALFLPVPGAWADGSPSDFLHSRTYIGLFGTSVSVDSNGIFKGTTYSRVNDSAYNSVEIDLLPTLAQNFGFGLLVGHREDAYAIEVSYWRSSHTASFGPATVGSNSGSSTVTFTSVFQDKADYNALNLDFKRYFLTELQVQPFVDLGVSFPWVQVAHGAANSKGENTSLTLAGLGLNLGIGVEYYLSTNLSFTAGGYQRWASFDESKGFGSQFSQIQQYGNSNSDAGGGLNFCVGTTLGFE